MIEIADLIKGHPDYGLWHGTKAKISGSLSPGDEIVGKAKEAIHQIWETISAERQQPVDQIYSENVLDFFPGSAHAYKNAVALGNSIRYLRGEFDYSGVAFGFNKFTARGYAAEGSELANAIMALVRSCHEIAPKLFESQNLRIATQTATAIAEELTSGTGKIMKLIKLPESGFFWAPGHPNIKVTTLSRVPFEDKIFYSELFFSEKIPIDHFEIEDI